MRQIAAALWFLVLAAALSAADEAASVHVPEGTPLHQGPSAETPVLAVLPGGELPLLDDWPGGWVRVRAGERSGWVHLGEGWRPPGESDPRRLSRALALLGDGARDATLGPLRLLTDLEEGKLLGYLERVAAHFGEAYQERFGLAAPESEGEVVVLFAEEEAYRRFESGEQALAGRRLTGHAGGGIAALFAGGRSRSELAATLLHELTHLVNRRLGADFPPWLEEGMAGEMEMSRIRRDGYAEPDPVARSGARPVRVIAGPWAAVPELLAGLDAGRLSPPRELVTLDAERFLGGDGGRLHYAQAILWVRYLLSRRGADLGDAFRSLLAAAGSCAASPADPGDPAAVAHRLGRDWEALEGGFRRWLKEVAEGLGFGPPAPRPR